MEHFEPVNSDTAKELFKKVHDEADVVPPPEPPPFPGVEKQNSDDRTNIAHSMRAKRKKP